MSRATVDPALVEAIRQRQAQRQNAPNPALVDAIRRRQEQRAAARIQAEPAAPARGMGTAAAAGAGAGAFGSAAGVARLGQSAVEFAGAVPRFIDTAKAAVGARALQIIDDPIGAAFGVAGVDSDAASVLEQTATGPRRTSEAIAGAAARPIRQAADALALGERATASAAPTKSTEPYSREWFAFNAGRMLPQVAASLGATGAGTVVGGAGGGLAAGFGVSFGTEAGEQAKSIYDAEIAKGADPESAAVAAFVPAVATGLVNAGIEQAGIERLVRTGQLANGIRRSLAEFAAAGASEGVQEAVQGNVQRMYADPAFDPATGENLSATGQEAVLGATMGLGAAVPAVAVDRLGRPTRAPAPQPVRPAVRPPAPAPNRAPDAPLSGAAAAAMGRLRGTVENQSQPPAIDRTAPVVEQAPAQVADVQANAPLVPPGEQPTPQDLADARAIIMRDPTVATQPSRFRREMMEVRAKRRAQPQRPMRPVMYTDDADMARVFGADPIGLTAARTQRERVNAPAQSAEGVGGQAGEVAVRGPDVPAAPAPAAGPAGAAPPADEGRGVEGTPRQPASPAPVVDGVGEVVRGQGAQARNQPGDVGVKQPWEMTRDEWNAKLTPQARSTFGAFQHRNFVLDALAEGLPVPDRVTAEYPGIVERAAQVRADAEVAEAETRKNRDRMDAEEAARKNEANAAYQANVDRNIAALNQRDAYLRDEAWKKRKSEYVTYKRGGAKQLQEADHREAVENAVAAGKPVPAEVLADYPDLAPKAEAKPNRWDGTPAAAFVGKPFVAFSKETGTNKIFTPSAKGDGGWQVTRFSRIDGKPSGDTLYPSWSEAVNTEARYGLDLQTATSPTKAANPVGSNRSEYPELNGERLVAKIDQYSTPNDAKDGYAKAKAVARWLTDTELAKQRDQLVKDSFDRHFGHNAKPFLAIADAEIARRGTPAPAASSAPRETGAADYAADIPERVAVAAHANTSHTPEKRGQQRRDEYAATLKSAREQLDAAAKTDEQKRIADAEFARYREGMKSRTLAYLQALSRTASSMITGPANFPVERNRKANAAADKRGEELRDFDKRARAAMLRAVNAAATPEMRADEETGRIEQITAKFIERSRDGFNAMSKQNFVGKLERAAKNGETQAVARALQMLREEGQRRGKSLFVNRASIWKLADVATEAVQAEASAPTGEQEHATYTDGTRVVRNYEDDRLRIFFPGKPSDAQRTTLKSRGFKWSPANGAWQRQNTQAAVFAADDILLGFGKQKNEAPPAAAAVAPTPPPAPAIDATTPHTKVDYAKMGYVRLVREARSRQIDSSGKRTLIEQRLRDDDAKRGVFQQQPVVAMTGGAGPSLVGDITNALHQSIDEHEAKVSGLRYGPAGTIRFEYDGATYETQEPRDTMPVESQGGNRWAAWKYVKREATRIESQQTPPASTSADLADLPRTKVVAEARKESEVNAVISRSEKIRQHLAKAIAGRKSPAVWIDHQLILEDGKYDVDENGKRTKTQDLSGAGFLKNAEEAYDAAQDGGSFAGINDAARDLVERVRAKREDRQDAERTEAEKARAKSDTESSAANAVRAVIDDAVAKAKFKTEDVTVKFGDETKTISMKVYKGLGVWKSPDSGWYNVTHIQSSKRFDTFKTQAMAKTATVRLAMLYDFTKDEATLLRSLGENEFRDEIRPVRDDVYAVTPRLAKLAGVDLASDLESRIAAIEQAAKERLAKRAKKQNSSKTLNAGINPAQLAAAARDTLDLSIVVAAKALNAKVFGGRSLTRIIEQTAKEAGKTLDDTARRLIRRNARKILTEANGDADAFERITADLFAAPLTKGERKAAARARKEATAKITAPGENAPPVAQADALRGRLRAEEREGQRVSKKAAKAITEATRRAYKSGQRDARREDTINAKELLNTIQREKAGLRILAAMERRAGAQGIAEANEAAKRAQMIRDGIRRQTLQYARTLPAKVRGKLQNAVANADTPVKMVRAVRMLQRELHRHEGREALRELAKITAKKRVAKIKGATNDLKAFIQKARADGYAAKKRIDNAETLAAAINALNDLRAILSETALQITLARMEYQAISGQRKQTAFQIATAAAETIRARMKAPRGGEVPDSTIQSRKVNKVRQHFDSYSDLRNMLETLEGADGPLQRAVWDALEAGSAMYATLQRDMKAAMEAAYVRAGFKDAADAIDAISSMSGRGVAKTYSVTIGGEPETLTLGELSAIIAHSTDPETAADIASETGQTFTSPEGKSKEIEPTPKEIKAMRAIVERDYKIGQLVDDFKKILDDTYPQVRRIVYELTGTEPAKLPGRWHKERDMELTPGMEDKPVTSVDPSLINVIRGFAENYGDLKDRTGSTLPIVLRDIHSVMEDQIHKQAAIIGQAKPVRDAMLILGNKELGKAIIEAKGIDFYRQIKRQVLASGRTEVVYATPAEKFVAFLKTSAATKMLATQPSTYIGNALGLLRVLPDISAKHYAAGMRAVMTMSRAELERKSGYLWERWEQQGLARFGPMATETADARNRAGKNTGGQAMLRELGRQARNALKNAGRGDLGAGLTNLRLGAATFAQGLNWVESRIAAFVWGATEARLRDERPSLKGKALEREVERVTRLTIRETQNGSDPVDAAAIATQNRSSAASLLMFLTSDAFKSGNRIKRAYRRSKVYGSKMLAAEVVGVLAKVYAVKYVWDAFAYGIALTLGDDDDRDRVIENMAKVGDPLTRAASELASIVLPIGGPDIKSIIDVFSGKSPTGTAGGVALAAPIIDASTALKRAIATTSKSIQDDDVVAERLILAWGQFVDEAASALGVNPFSPWTRRALREIVRTRKDEW